MATITIPASGAVQVRIRYTMENITDGTSYGKTKITITGMDASNATGISVGSGNPAFGVKLRLVSTDTLTESLYEFSGTAGSVPSVPLGSGFSAFPGLSSASVTVARTSRNENFQFLITKYAGFGGGGWNPCFVYGSPSKPLYLGNQLSAAPWGSAEIAMPDAATASTISVSNGTIGSPIAITINRASTAFTHKLSYSFGGASGIIAENAATSVSWTPDIGLCGQIPSAVSGICTLTCYTYSGSSLIGTSAANIWLSCPAWVAPSVAEGWASVGFDNTGTPAENMACFVQGYSKANVTLDSSKVTHSYGASTASTKISFGGVDYADTTPVLTASGQQSITVTVTDSRGRTASQTVKITVLPYSKPVLYGVNVFRCNLAGAADDGGTYYAAVASVSFSDLGGRNTVTLTARHRTTGGSFGDARTLTPGTASVFGQILTTTTYVVELTAADLLGNTVVNTANIPTSTVGLHLRPGHDGAAFGKYCEHERAFELPDNWRILIGGKKVSAGNPRNLLDNSDFRNPVMQAGLNGTHGSMRYACDRWLLESEYATAVQDLVGTLGFGFTGTSTVMQLLYLEPGKTYTAAVNVHAVSPGAMLLIQEWGYNWVTYIHTPLQAGINVFHFTATTANLTRFAFYGSGAGDGVYVRWAALYEGEYTAETIPEYQPKGYGTELAECLRYYEKIDYFPIQERSSGDIYYSACSRYYPKRCIPTFSHKNIINGPSAAFPNVTIQYGDATATAFRYLKLSEHIGAIAEIVGLEILADY